MKVLLDEDAFLPERAHATDAGLDIRTPHDVTIYPGDAEIIDTGIHVELPRGTVGMLKSKSGLNVKYGITSEGVIDEGYTGSIKAKLYNHGKRCVQFRRGDKITQLVILPVLTPEVELATEISGGERGDAGFGSTGK